MTRMVAPSAFLLASAASLCFAAPAAVQTATPELTGVEIGLRAGYGIPFGNRFDSEPLGQTFDGSMPLAIDVGFRLTPELYAGVLVSYGRLRMDKSGLQCNTVAVDGPGDCSGSTYRLAANAQWRVPLTPRLLGWVDGGFGLERLIVRFDSGCFGGPTSRTDDGVELGHLEAGGGARLGNNLVVGPFASYAVGLFRTSTFTGSCQGHEPDLDRSLHGNLTMGVRAMVMLR